MFRLDVDEGVDSALLFSAAVLSFPCSALLFELLSLMFINGGKPDAPCPSLLFTVPEDDPPVIVDAPALELGAMFRSLSPVAGAVGCTG